MLLQEILNKEKNNLDIFRIISALMVIYGHAYAILPSTGSGDVLKGLLGFDYSGSLAVKIFFFLSGLVVTNSLLTKRSLIPFLIARFFRIWPALAFTLLVSAFLLGPLLSEQSPAEYFSNKKVLAYFYKGLSMNIKYELPGVFEDNALRAVNGSLWSIPHEVFAYLTLAALLVLVPSRVIIYRKGATLCSVPEKFWSTWPWGEPAGARRATRGFPRGKAPHRRWLDRYLTPTRGPTRGEPCTSTCTRTPVRPRRSAANGAKRPPRPASWPGAIT